jgi:hypothetical protein
MKRLITLFLFSIVAAPMAALAQSDDTKAILDALKGLGDRMDGMQRQIDQLKSGPAAPAPATAPAKSPPAEAPGPAARGTPSGGTPPGMKLVPGWVVQVIPYEEGNPSPDALFQFTAPKLPLKFNAHLATKNTDNWVRYRGEAKLNVYEAGRHVFLVDIAVPRGPDASCSVALSIGGKDVVSTPEKSVHVVKDQTTLTVSGGLDMAVGNYDATFSMACQTNGGQSNAGYLGRGNNFYNQKEEWLGTSFNIQVRGPSDSVPRAFEPTELFHYVRQRASAPGPAGAVDRAAAGDAVETASTEPPQLVRTSGVRTIVSEVNVRSKPSTAASLATRLEPGMQVRLVARTSDEEWHQVAVGDRVVGFVKTTALAANSR